ncbi:MAG: hypothetical protein KUG73_12555, partial [Pseudomonadales bacterium]|nr:hypothetical protein [Pseudomonadales bacterium]
INCPDICVREVTDKQTITLTAIPDSDSYAFHHWEGACTNTDPICVLEIHPLLPFNVKAQFAYTGIKLGDIEFEDKNLEACIQEMRPDYQYIRAWLSHLDCVDRGIESLAGIEELDSYHSYFNLESNLISDLSPIEGHTFLKSLNLRSNAIVDPAPLSSVVVLAGSMFLSGNPELDCEAMHSVVDGYFQPNKFHVEQCDIFPEIVLFDDEVVITPIELPDEDVVFTSGELP